jgi:hypothetical protein
MIKVVEWENHYRAFNALNAENWRFSPKFKISPVQCDADFIFWKSHFSGSDTAYILTI